MCVLINAILLAFEMKSSVFLCQRIKASSLSISVYICAFFFKIIIITWLEDLIEPRLLHSLGHTRRGSFSRVAI